MLANLAAAFPQHNIAHDMACVHTVCTSASLRRAVDRSLAATEPSTRATASAAQSHGAQAQCAKTYISHTSYPRHVP